MIPKPLQRKLFHKGVFNSFSTKSGRGSGTFKVRNPMAIIIHSGSELQGLGMNESITYHEPGQ